MQKAHATARPISAARYARARRCSAARDSAHSFQAVNARAADRLLQCSSARTSAPRSAARRPASASQALKAPSRRETVWKTAALRAGRGGGGGGGGAGVTRALASRQGPAGKQELSLGPTRLQHKPLRADQPAHISACWHLVRSRRAS
jgi:hypothetical protein